MSKLPITAVLLTLNEEHNLPGALDDLGPWVEQIFVVDSLSTDRTVDIALDRGAGVVQRRFTDFGDQWNWALDRLPIVTPWTMKVDPDERFPEQLVSEIRRLLTGKPEHEAYQLRRRLWFMGEPLNQMQWVARLWRTGTCRFSEVIVNEQPIVRGTVGRLRGIMDHLDSRDLHEWYDKQNRYTTMEAIMRASGGRLAAAPRLLGAPIERRMLVKRLFYRLPFRYALLWAYHALWRRGIFAGPEGRAWCRMRVELYRTIDYKTREMQSTGRVPEIPRARHGAFDPRVLASELQAVVEDKGSRPRSENGTRPSP